MYISDSDSFYDCNWNGGQAHGQGVFKMGSGDVYEGGFHQGDRHGKGVYTWSDGSRISAVWEFGSTLSFLFD